MDESLIDLADNGMDSDQLVTDAVTMNINMDNYLKADATAHDSSYGFVDFGDNLVDDLRVDQHMLDQSYTDKQQLADREKKEK